MRTMTTISKTNIATDTPINIGRFFSCNQSVDVWASGLTTVITLFVVLGLVEGCSVLFTTTLGVTGMVGVTSTEKN